MLIFHKWQFGFLTGALSSMLSCRVVVLTEAQCSGTNYLGNEMLECFVLLGAWFRGPVTEKHCAGWEQCSGRNDTGDKGVVLENVGFRWHCGAVNPHGYR